MKKNKITPHPNGKGYLVSPNWDEIDRARELINDALKNADLTYSDALSALCLTAIEVAYTAKITKPQFLMHMTNWWEELDSNNTSDEK